MLIYFFVCFIICSLQIAYPFKNSKCYGFLRNAHIFQKDDLFCWVFDFNYLFLKFEIKLYTKNPFLVFIISCLFGHYVVKIRFERKIQDIATYSPKMIETWEMFLQAYAISGEIFKKDLSESSTSRRY